MTAALIIGGCLVFAAFRTGMLLERWLRNRGGACRMCGCTDEDACIEGEEPCFWVNRERTLCSACLEEAEAMP